MKQIYCVRDAASELYDDPVVVRAPGEAMRAFEGWARNPETLICKNPEHFSLWHVGSYDPATGKIEAIEPVCLVKAVDIPKER